MKEEKTPFIPDSRFKAIKNEAITIVALLFVLMIIFLIIAATLGAGNPLEYSFVCGFPLWFVACLAVELIFIAVFCWLLLKKFSDVSLEADDPAYNYEEASK